MRDHHLDGGVQHAAIEVGVAGSGEVKSDPQLRRAVYEAIGRPPAYAFIAVLDRWVGQGVIPVSAPTDVIAALVPAVALRDLVVHNRSLDPSAVVRLVDDVLLPVLSPAPETTAGTADTALGRVTGPVYENDST